MPITTKQFSAAGKGSGWATVQDEYISTTPNIMTNHNGKDQKY